MNKYARFEDIKKSLYSTGFRERRRPNWFDSNPTANGLLRVVINAEDDCVDVIRFDGNGCTQWKINLAIYLPEAVLSATLTAALAEVGAVWNAEMAA